MSLRKSQFEQFQPFFNVLGNKTRFDILCLLLKQPHTVTEIYDALHCKQTKISNDLKCLRDCGYVHVEKEGTARIYSLDERLLPILESIASELASMKKICTSCPLCRKRKVSNYASNHGTI